jgi:signal transduction histidine kinase
MRALIFELRPGALAEEGLVAALQRQAAALTAREGLPIMVSGPAERPPLTPPAEEHLYRLVLEALHNTIKHAAARSAAVTVGIDGADLVVCVADDGIGFDPTTLAPGHLGQRTMRERADALGGRLTVDSAPGSGCRVTVRVPLTSD